MTMTATIHELEYSDAPAVTSGPPIRPDGGWCTHDEASGEFHVNVSRESAYLAPEIGEAIIAGLYFFDATASPAVAFEAAPTELVEYVTDNGERTKVGSLSPWTLYWALSSVASLPDCMVSNEVRILAPRVMDDLEKLIGRVTLMRLKPQAI